MASEHITPISTPNVREIYLRIRSEVSPLKYEAELAKESPAVGSRVRKCLDGYWEAVRDGYEQPFWIGDRKIIDELGRGGMGIVYRAEQYAPQMQVAVKLVQGGRAASEVFERFRLEGEILVGLNHPNIVRILGGNTLEPGIHGCAHIVMELVKGGLLINQYVRNKAILPAQRLKLFLTICQAVHAGHLQKIIHRDLKPENILVDLSGDIKVLDFGIACFSDSAPDGLQTAGSPCYMAPEQANPGAAVDARADVYALGILLFELLTDKLPYALPNSPENGLAEAIRTVRAATLQETLPSAPRELNAIVAKCLEKDPERRFTTVNELAVNIDLYLRRMPVPTYSSGNLYRVHKFCARSPGLAAAISVATISMLVGIIFAAVAWKNDHKRASAVENMGVAERRAEAAERRENNATTREAVIKLTAEQSIGMFSDTLANGEAYQDQQQAYEELCNRVVKFGAPRFPADVGLWSQRRSRPNSLFYAGLGSQKPSLAGIDCMVSSPDNTRIYAGGWGFICEFDHTLSTPAYNFLTGSEIEYIPTFGSSPIVKCLAMSADGHYLAAAVGSHISVWDTRSRAILRKFDLEEADQNVHILAFTLDGRSIAAGNRKGVITVWRVLDGTPLFRVPATGIGPSIESLSVSPDGAYLLAACGSGFMHDDTYTYTNVLRIWQLATGKEQSGMLSKDFTGSLAVFSSDGSMIFCTDGSKLRIWNLKSTSESTQIEPHHGFITRLMPDPVTPTQVYCECKYDGTVFQCDTAHPHDFRTIRVRQAPIRASTLSADGHLLLTFDDINIWTAWDTSAGSHIQRIGGDDSKRASLLAVSPDGRWLSAVTDTESKTIICVWDAVSGLEVSRLTTDAYARSLAFSPDSSSILITGPGIVLWHPFEDGPPLVLSKSNPRALPAFSADGRSIVSVDRQGNLVRIPVDGGIPVSRAPAGKPMAVGATADVFHPSVFWIADHGKWLVEENSDGLLKIWNCDTGALVFDEQKEDSFRPINLDKLNGHAQVFVSLEGDQVFVIRAEGRGYTGNWRIADRVINYAGYDLSTWKVRFRKTLPIGMGAPDGSAYSITVSPDRHWLLFASVSQPVQLWNLETAHQLRTIGVGNDLIHAAAFIPVRPISLKDNGGPLYRIAYASDTGVGVWALDRCDKEDQFEQDLIPWWKDRLKSGSIAPMPDNVLAAFGRYYALHDFPEIAISLWNKSPDCSKCVPPQEMAQCYWALSTKRLIGSTPADQLAYRTKAADFFRRAVEATDPKDGGERDRWRRSRHVVLSGPYTAEVTTAAEPPSESPQ